MEEDTDVGIHPRASLHHCLDPPTKTLLNLGGKGAVDEQSHRPVPKRKVARITLAADPESLPQQIGGKFALLFHGFRDARAQHFEQTWDDDHRSEEHTSELQSLMRSSYAVFCLKKTKTEV